jgi:hypothetical protein
MENTPTITIDSLVGILNATCSEFEAIIAQLDLDAPAPAEGEWTPRQVLSHVIGALHRTPQHVGYFLATVPEIPIIFNDPYWLSLWDSAPKAAFVASLRAEVAGNKALLQNLDAAALETTMDIPGFGVQPLGVFLLISYQKHVNEHHVPQLRAFLTVQELA